MAEEPLKWREFEYKVLFWTSWGTSLVTICIFVICVMRLLFPEDVTPRLQEFNRRLHELRVESNGVNVAIKSLEREAKSLNDRRAALQSELKSLEVNWEPKLAQGFDEIGSFDLGNRSLSLIRELKTNLQQLADFNRRRLDLLESERSKEDLAPSPPGEIKERESLIEKIRNQLRDLKQMCADKHLVAMAAAERWLAEQEQLAPETDWPLMRLASRLLSDQVAVEGVIVVDNTVSPVYRPEKSLTVAESIESVNQGLKKGKRLLQLAEYTQQEVLKELQNDKYWNHYFNSQSDPVANKAKFLTVRELSSSAVLLDFASATDNVARQPLARTLAEQWVTLALPSAQSVIVPYAGVPKSEQLLELVPLSEPRSEPPAEPSLEEMVALETPAFFNALAASPKAQSAVRAKMIDSLADCLERIAFPEMQEIPVQQLDAESESIQAIVQMLVQTQRALTDLNIVNDQIRLFVTTVYTNQFGSSFSYSYKNAISVTELLPEKVIGQLLESKNRIGLAYWPETFDPESTIRTEILSFEQRVEQWRERIAEIDEKFGLEQQRLRKLAEEERLAHSKRQERLENELLVVNHDINMVEARLEANRERAVECTALSAKAETQYQQELESQRKYGTPAAWGSIIGAVGGAACQLVAGTVLLILTRVGATLTQYRQAESEERRQSEKLKLLDNIKNAKLREHTIAALLTAQPVSPPTSDPTELGQPTARKKRPTKRTKGNAEAN